MVLVGIGLEFMKNVLRKSKYLLVVVLSFLFVTFLDIAFFGFVVECAM